MAELISNLNWNKRFLLFHLICIIFKYINNKYRINEYMKNVCSCYYSMIIMNLLVHEFIYKSLPAHSAGYPLVLSLYSTPKQTYPGLPLNRFKKESSNLISILCAPWQTKNYISLKMTPQKEPWWQCNSMIK